MIEHDPCIRKGAGEIGEFADLRMKQPGIETQTERRQASKTLSESLIEQQALRPGGIHARDIGISVKGGRMPDAAEATLAALVSAVAV